MTEALTLDIPLAGRAYKAHVGPGLLASLGELIQPLSPGNRCALITDSVVAPLYAEKVQDSLQAAGFPTIIITIPSGEASKSMDCAEECCRQMIRAGCDRHSFVVALGGGVVGDLAGFVAGIFYRGLPLIQVPTTVVSQVDSSVGGKTGVNTGEGKNLIGVFHQPRLVVADIDTLKTLPDREYREGFAEIIKHAAIRDPDLIPLIQNASRDEPAALTQLIARNIQIKAAIVVEDEYETTGTRALLNFGHTIGHAIEAAAGYGRLFHGEAISLGLIAATRLSMAHSTLTQNDAEWVFSLIKQFDLPQSLPSDLTTGTILSYLKRDKKFVDGQMRFVLLERFGKAFVSSDVDLKSVESAIEGLRT